MILKNEIEEANSFKSISEKKMTTVLTCIAIVFEISKQCKRPRNRDESQLPQRKIDKYLLVLMSSCRNDLVFLENAKECTKK